MKHLILTAALLAFTAPAFAGQCPADMAAIDAALEAGTELSEADLTMVQDLRAEGEAQHASGDHAGSVETLAKAKEMLGIN